MFIVKISLKNSGKMINQMKIYLNCRTEHYTYQDKANIHND